MSRRGGFGGQSEEQMIMQQMMIKMMMSINKQCFSECVNSFKEDKLSQSEVTCVNQCARRQSGAFAAMNDIQDQVGSKTGGLF
jgi:hypothetical protein